jgi:hypothetical protein
MNGELNLFFIGFLTGSIFIGIVIFGFFKISHLKKLLREKDDKINQLEARVREASNFYGLYYRDVPQTFPHNYDIGESHSHKGYWEELFNHVLEKSVDNLFDKFYEKISGGNGDGYKKASKVVTKAGYAGRKNSKR